MDGSRHIAAEAGDRHRADWHKWVGLAVRYLIPLGVSVGLIAWLFHKVDIHEIIHIVRHGCDYRWIALMMLITTLSHMIRGLRWGIQLRGAGIPRLPVMVEYVSIFGAYALNLVFPRLGEVWRCIYISHRGHAPISTVVGTDIGDRASDAVVVMALFALSLVVARPAIDNFLQHYAVGKDVERLADNIWMWIAVVGGLTVLWAAGHFMKRYRYVRSVDAGLQRVWAGFKVLFTMRGIGMYLVLTVGIWTCYFLETYVCFFAFPFTRQMITEPGMAYGLIPGLVVFVFGSFSMAIPSNGGLGPWNLAVMFALSLYGISDAQGAAFSLVMWGSQAAMLVGLGLFSAGYIMLSRSKDKDDKVSPSSSECSN